MTDKHTWRQAEERHDKAMWCLDQAEIVKLHKLNNDIDGLLKDALYYELDAAMLLSEQEDTEPSRSILFDSAANIANRLGKPSLAECIKRRIGNG